MSRRRKLPKASRRLFKSQADKETKFVSCLLANGPPPEIEPWTGQTYEERVKEWWRACNTSTPSITDKGIHRFWNRYRRWLSEERYRRRRLLRDERKDNE